MSPLRHGQGMTSSSLLVSAAALLLLSCSQSVRAEDEEASPVHQIETRAAAAASAGAQMAEERGELGFSTLICGYIWCLFVCLLQKL